MRLPALHLKFFCISVNDVLGELIPSFNCPWKLACCLQFECGFKIIYHCQSLRFEAKEYQRYLLSLSQCPHFHIQAENTPYGERIPLNSRDGHSNLLTLVTTLNPSCSALDHMQAELLIVCYTAVCGEERCVTTLKTAV